MRKKTFGRLAAAGLVIAGMALSAPALAETGRTITGGFDVGPGGFQGNFNPLLATAGFTWLSTYYEPLVIYNAELTKIIPDLATDIAVSKDHLSYTFKLAKTNWQDGKPFTSADVKFTFALAMNAKSGSIFAARLSDVASVETPDASTAVVKLKKPNPAFLAVITQLMMLPKHALEAIPVDQIAQNKWWSTKPIGTGPFKFDKYVSDQYVELDANDDYRGGKPKVAHLIDRYFANPASAVAALKAGEIQFTYVGADAAKTFDGNTNYRVIPGNSFVVNYIGFNYKTDLWKDLRVRQAVMYAINRKQIIKSLYGGAAALAMCGYVAPNIVPSGLNPYDYDPAKAKALLKAAGWDKINGDKPISWVTYYNSPQVANVMAAMQAMLAQVGINVQPRAVDVPTYNSIVLGHDWNQFPMVFAGAGDGPSPATLNVNLSATQAPPVGNNTMRINMPPLTDAINKAMGETDQAKAATDWQGVCTIMNKSLPWGSMWVAKRYGVASTKLKDFVWTPAPGGGPYQANPEKWDIAP